MADGSFLTTGSTFNCSQSIVVENCVMYNESGGHITESTWNISLTDHEICCGISWNGSSLN